MKERFALLSIIALVISVAPLTAGGWLHAGWSYRKMITNVRAVDSNIAGYTLFIRVTNDLALQTYAHTDGHDIIFASNNASVADVFSHEVEYFDKTSGTLIAWVYMPTLSTNAEENILYMYFGNDDITAAQETPSNTWDASYALVMHFRTNNPYVDSSSNYLPSEILQSGTEMSAASNGIAGKGVFFAGGGPARLYVDYTNAALSEAKTFEFWYSAGALPISGPGIFLHAQDASSQYYYSMKHWHTGSEDKKWARIETPSAGNQSPAIFTNNTNGVFVHVAVTINENEDLIVYANGEQVHTWSVVAETTDNSGGTVDIGSQTGGGSYLFGTLDEVRISSTCRASNEIATTYSNIQYGYDGGFYSIGAQENASVSYYTVTVTLEGALTSGVAVVIESNGVAVTNTTDGSGVTSLVVPNTVTGIHVRTNGYVTDPITPLLFPVTSDTNITLTVDACRMDIAVTGNDDVIDVTFAGTNIYNEVVSFTRATSSGVLVVSDVETGTYTITPSDGANAIFPDRYEIAFTTNTNLTFFTSTPYTIAGSVSGDGQSGAVVSLYTNDAVYWQSNVSAPFYDFIFTVTSTNEMLSHYKVLVESHSGYAFYPLNRTLYISNESMTNTTFATREEQFLTGTVSGVSTNVRVACVWAGVTNYTTSDSAGAFSFSVANDAVYSVLPIYEGYVFFPPVKTVTVYNELPESLTFFARTSESIVNVTYTVAGAIADASGNTYAGVALTLSGTNTYYAVSDTNGAFSFTGIPQGTYSLAPSSSTHTFTETNMTLVVTNDIADANYTVVGGSAGLTLTSSVVAPGSDTLSLTVTKTDAGYDRVRITLVDVAGREVLRAYDGMMAGGTHALSIPLTTAFGGKVKSGVYVLTMTVAGDAGSTRYQRVLVITE